MLVKKITSKEQKDSIFKFEKNISKICSRRRKRLKRAKMANSKKEMSKNDDRLSPISGNSNDDMCNELKQKRNQDSDLSCVDNDITTEVEDMEFECVPQSTGHSSTSTTTTFNEKEVKNAHTHTTNMYMYYM